MPILRTVFRPFYSWLAFRPDNDCLAENSATYGILHLIVVIGINNDVIRLSPGIGHLEVISFSMNATYGLSAPSILSSLSLIERMAASVQRMTLDTGKDTNDIIILGIKLNILLPSVGQPTVSSW